MDSRRLAGAMLAGMIAVALGGCGGGGGEDEPEDADAGGLYAGTMNLDGTARTFNVAVRPDGVFVGGFSAAPGGTNSRVMYGVGVADGDDFTATGTSYAPAGAPFSAGGTVASLSITNGAIDEGVRLQGNYAAGGESGNFTVNYRAEITGRGALLSRIAGTYASNPASAQNVTVTITGTGAVTLAGNGCTGTGQINILDPAVNVYSIDLVISTCSANVPVSGVASLEDAPAGGTNNFLLFLAATASQSNAYGFSGTRQ
jgi:hypothetical protein